MVLLQQMTKNPTPVVAVKDLSECLNERLMFLTRDCLVFDLLVYSLCLTLVFDTYRDHSLKSAIRDKRRQGRVPIQYQVKDDTIIKHTVSAPVSCSWQGIDSSLVASARAVDIILIYIFIITAFDCQGGSRGGGISARAFALVCPGVAPPLKTHPRCVFRHEPLQSLAFRFGTNSFLLRDPLY